MGLNRLEIINFKKIEHIDIPLDKINVFVGPNNSGKSSILQALQFGVSALQSVERINTKDWKNDRRSATLSVQELMYTPVATPSSLGRSGSFNQKSGMRFKFSDEGGDSCEVNVTKGKNKNLLIRTEGEALGRELSKMDPLYSALAPGLAGIPSQEEYKSPGVVRKAAARGDSNAYLRNILNTLGYIDPEDEENCPGLNLLCERLDQVFPGANIRIFFDEDNDDFIVVEAKVNEHWVPLELCGTGFLQTVHILSYICLYEPSVLILDEPDSHLHPQNQRNLIRLLDELSEELDFQILISTHSRQLIDEAVDLGASIRWLSGGELQELSDDRASYLSDLGALDSLDSLGDESYPLVVITEDSKGGKFLEPILKSNGWERGEYQIISCHGSSNLPAIGVLVEFIKDRFPDTKVVVYRDRDFDDEALDKMRRVAEDKGARFFTSPGNDIESFFLNPKHLASVFGDSLDYDTVLHESYVSSRKKCEHNMMNAISVERLFGEKVWKKAGDTSKFVEKKMNEDPFRWYRGKFVLNSFVNECQNGTGGTKLSKTEMFDVLLRGSEALREPVLRRP